MIYRLSENIDACYNKMSRLAKVLALAAILAIILFLIVSICKYNHMREQRDQAVASYENLLEKSYQNYYIQGLANSNLEKKLQDLSIELATLRNSALDLEEALRDWRADYADLVEIKKRMSEGVRKTKLQLDQMSTSVNSIIEQRRGDLINNAREYRAKKDSLGVRARYPEGTKKSVSR